MNFKHLNSSYFQKFRISIQDISIFRSSLLIALLLVIFFSCKEEKSAVLPSFKEASVSNTRPRYLIPYPNNVIYSNDEFTLQKILCYVGMPDDLKPALVEMDRFYKGIIHSWKRRSRDLFLKDIDKDACTSVRFRKNDNLIDDAYKLIIQDSIVIEYKESAGAFYALQTLKQIIRNSAYTTVGPSLVISKIIIDDQARFKYRGIHLDVARHFMPVEEVKQFIKMLAAYKINKFHWHLTDDQGWRIEIQRYPKLQKISSHRSQTIISTKPVKYDGKDYGGFYSQRDIRKIVAYAQTMFVEIIPEIEMTGHSRALLAAHPELSCRKMRLPVATKWGEFDHVLCPKDTTITFMKNVLSEVMSLFPSKYIHIGGRDPITTEWTNNKECQDIMKLNKLTEVNQLYGYFIHQIIEHVEESGKKVIGWDEITENDLQDNITVMALRGIDEGIKAASNGYDVIMTPKEYCNLDSYQSLDSSEPKAAEGYLPLENVYNYNPVPENFKEKIKKHIIGTQGNLWTEYMKTLSEVSYMAFPRLLAIAEIGWTNNEKKNWERFGNNIDIHIPFIRKSRFKYSKKLYDPTYETYNQNGLVFLKLVQKMKAGYIKYWSTRSNSERLSQVYQEPILLTEVTNLRMKYFSSTQKFATDNFTIKFKSNIASGRNIAMRNDTKEPFKSDTNLDVLLNGIQGNTDKLLYNQEWKLVDENIELLIDLKDTISARTLVLSFIQDKKSKSSKAVSAKINYGVDLENMEEISPSRIKGKIEEEKNILNINIRDKSIRYLKISPILKQTQSEKTYMGEIEIK